MRRRDLPVAALTLLTAASLPPSANAEGGELRVMLSGAFAAAYARLAPLFERQSGLRLVTIRGASAGPSPDAIPNRLARGERADVFIMADGALRDLAVGGNVAAPSIMRLAAAPLGAAVRRGAPRSSIGTLDEFRAALLAAPSIGMSPGAASAAMVRDVFPRLGIAESVGPRLRQIAGEPVGAAVARGEVALGIQPLSELIPIPGIEVLGPLPPGSHEPPVFSAGLATEPAMADAARSLLRFLVEPTAEAAMRDTGLQPLSAS
jgi:molybdate transport system substrate-binding protein